MFEGRLKSNKSWLIHTHYLVSSNFIIKQQIIFDKEKLTAIYDMTEEEMQGKLPTYHILYLGAIEIGTQINLMNKKERTIRRIGVYSQGGWDSDPFTDNNKGPIKRYKIDTEEEEDFLAGGIPWY